MQLRKSSSVQSAAGLGFTVGSLLAGLLCAEKPCVKGLGLVGFRALGGLGFRGSA